MKALFIFPPFYSQFSISCGIPQILSYLKAKNYDVKSLDLNIKFFNYLYNEKVFNNLLLETYEIYKNKDKYNLPSEYSKLLEEFFSNKKLVYKVHNAIKNIDKGIFPKAFCKIIPDILGGDEEYCNIMHADGAGTKSSLAYLYWKETGDISVWKGIAQDALIMNIDDLLCVGATDNILVSSTIGRNKLLIPGEVISAGRW